MYGKQRMVKIYNAKKNIYVDHILCKCEFMNNLYQQNNIIIDSTKDIKDILNDNNIIKVLNMILEFWILIY